MPARARWGIYRTASPPSARSASAQVLTELPMATTGDLDDAYANARAAQRDWADRLPGERAAVMRAAGWRLSRD
ncbi:aldehyde dehydrogenase family protein [Nocardia inohanensis]|uniref:aldehyde dehydrogenase family protein n=1 Tax=Nocardia inohanensis TaxID=209246 RepID=UPI0012FA87D0|nr:aldehyde dehydrogenase family protein [Nocardia inohanensis]